MSETVTTLIPHLACQNAAEAYDFYPKAFGAEQILIHRLPDGRVMHAALKIGDSTFYLVDEFPEHGGKGPLTLGGSPITLHLQVADVDASFQRAVDAGCTVQMPVEDMFWGDRYGLVTDPYGHKWSIATTIRQVSPEEIQKAAASM